MSIVDKHEHTTTLVHYGVKGQRWGVRKKRETASNKPRVDENSKNSTTDFLKDGFTIKKGTTLNRVSQTSQETHSGSTYASFLKEDSKTYNDLGKVFSKFGAQHYQMTFKATKDLTSPSKKERVETFKKLMDDPEFNREYKKATKRMYIFKIPTKRDVALSKEFAEMPLKKSIAYRNLNLAIGTKKGPLREKYLDAFRKKHYDFILDEADANNKISTSPIVIIEKSNGLSVVNVDKL